MSVEMPIIKTVTPNSAASTVIPSELMNKPYRQNQSFGIKFKPLDDDGKLGRFNKWLDNNFDSTWQRLVSGVTAIFTQPFFDLHNKKTDEDTRRTSCARTIGKIIAGTATGVAIRAGCIKLTEMFTRTNSTEAELVRLAKEKSKVYEPRKNFKPLEQCLLSKEAIEKASFREIKKYRGAMGTFAALFVMIFTNFLIDAPLTMYLTNKITPKLKNKSEKNVNTNENGGKQ